MSRLRVVVRGAVQGVGFRPFVHRLAVDLALQGYVRNTSEGVLAEVEGAEECLRRFLLRLQREAPPPSVIQGLEPSWLPVRGHRGFDIRPSDTTGESSALIPPDLATCAACRREIFDPGDRRFRYPFTNCTQCGPRFTILEAMPYDRGRTSMRRFAMCAACRSEYDDPAGRRFHAQPNACPDCGPQLAWLDADGRPLSSGDKALTACVDALRGGAIVAVKGLGGYHLMTRAGDEIAVRRLRARKRREEKPFALMVPDLEFARRGCEVEPLEQRLLESPEAPIVLLRRRESPASAARPAEVAAAVAPGFPQLGLMLPAAPLHHLLLADLGGAVVATSGNRGEEPICHDDAETLDRLGGIADYFLVHDRPIVRAVDDSIVAVMAGREMVLRRARGYAPWPVTIASRWFPQEDASGPATSVHVLAAGGHGKSALAFSRGRRIFLSQHLGDLDNVPARRRFRRAREDLEQLLEVRPAVVAVDAHPDYASTQMAREWAAEDPEKTLVRVPHHDAHALACLAENDLEPPALAVVWDGAGYGLDGTVWGGEFLAVTDGGCARAAHWRTFPLPGGDVAAREPRRAGLGLLWEAFGRSALRQTDLATLRAFSPAELKLLGRALERGLHAPLTSSAGRLFDAVASLIGARQVDAFEGQAAMSLEFLAGHAAGASAAYEIECREDVVDWEPMLRGLLRDLRTGLSPGELAARFHRTLIEAIVIVAVRAGRETVVLTGGCFQNRRLLEGAVGRLREEGFRPAWPQRVPPNDGGLALGQVLAAWQAMARQS